MCGEPAENFGSTCANLFISLPRFRRRRRLFLLLLFSARDFLRVPGVCLRAATSVSRFGVWGFAFDRSFGPLVIVCMCEGKRVV